MSVAWIVAPGQLFCEGHRDAAGAGADVGNLQAFAAECLLVAGANFADGEAVERDFDDVFGFRAGDQDVRGDFKFEAPEFLLAGEVLRGLASGAAGEQAGKRDVPRNRILLLQDAHRATCGRGRARA